MNAAFWRGRRVFITGHTGFKGSWLALWLQDLGAKVSGYALAPDSTQKLFHAADVGSGMHSRFADVRDLPALKESVQQARPEIVFHLAAQPLVRRSYREPVETYATNVMGTVHLLEAVRLTGGVAAVVVVTTDKCYEQHATAGAFSEVAALGGHDPYSSSKACAELVTSAYRRAFFKVARSDVPAATESVDGTSSEPATAVASARAGNVIGGGDESEDRLLPDLLRAFQAQQSAAIRHPMATRPWQHVLEPLAGYLQLAEQLLVKGHPFDTAWNFGPLEGDVQSVGWIADYLAQRWGAGARWHSLPGPHPHEAPHLQLNSHKARQLLGWEPRLTLAQALDMTVDWTRARAQGRSARQLCLAQISDYARAL